MKDTEKILITETVFRDAHQCLLATRMRTEDMLPICETLDRAGYWSMEVWGGATFDACLRFLKEDPWDRLRKLKAALPKTQIQMLLRGQNIVGYRHYPDDVLRKFIERAHENGVQVFRVFDALNDLRNLEVSAREIKRHRAHLQLAVCYTTGPIYDAGYFADLSGKLADLGADSLCIKDMAGLLSPYAAEELVRKIKSAVPLPLHLHTHDTAGFATATVLKAIEAGVNGVDTAISPLASGASQAPTETMAATLKGTLHDTGLDLDALSEAGEYFRKVRKKYRKFESEYTGVNTNMLIWQIPGGMISNLASQLKDQNALDKMKDVLEEVPRVRKDMGYPPLVTPTSQIVGTQATLNVLAEEKYTVIATETKNYLKGLYGKPPGPVSEELLKRAVGKEKIIACRPADILEPELEKLSRDLGPTARGIEDVLSYALFPSAAMEFFEWRAKGLPPPAEEDVKEETSRAPAPHYAPSEFVIKVHGEPFHVKIAGAGPKGEEPRAYFIQVNGKLEEVLVESLVEVVPTAQGEIVPKPVRESARPKAREIGDVSTPIPGKVVKIKVSEGAKVKAGTTVLVLEAMKMENEIHTPIDGVVKKILVKVGDEVNPQETLMKIG